MKHNKIDNAEIISFRTFLQIICDSSSYSAYYSIIFYIFDTLYFTEECNWVLYSKREPWIVILFSGTRCMCVYLIACCMQPFACKLQLHLGRITDG